MSYPIAFLSSKYTHVTQARQRSLPRSEGGVREVSRTFETRMAEEREQFTGEDMLVIEGGGGGLVSNCSKKTKRGRNRKKELKEGMVKMGEGSIWAM